MMLHPELLRAANTARRPLGLATALLAAVTATHLAQAVLLALVLARIARGRRPPSPRCWPPSSPSSWSGPASAAPSA